MRPAGFCEEVDLETVRVTLTERRRPAGIFGEEEPARCRRSDRRSHGEKSFGGDGGRRRPWLSGIPRTWPREPRESAKRSIWRR